MSEDTKTQRIADETPDYAEFRMLPVWPMYQAVCVLCNLNPPSDMAFRRAYVWLPHNTSAPRFKEISRAYGLIKAAIFACEFPDKPEEEKLWPVKVGDWLGLYRLDPPPLLKFATRVGIAIPEELLALKGEPRAPESLADRGRRWLLMKLEMKAAGHLNFIDRIVAEEGTVARSTVRNAIAEAEGKPYKKKKQIDAANPYAQLIRGKAHK
jgi:hypothetical protein